MICNNNINNRNYQKYSWGARGREFESRHPDPVKSRPQSNLGPCCFWPVQTWFKQFCKHRTINYQLFRNFIGILLFL